MSRVPLSGDDGPGSPRTRSGSSSRSSLVENAAQRAGVGGDGGDQDGRAGERGEDGALAQQPRTRRACPRTPGPRRGVGRRHGGRRGPRRRPSRRARPGRTPSSWSSSGRPARWTVRRLARVPGCSPCRPRICSSRSTSRAVGASSTRVVMPQVAAVRGDELLRQPAQLGALADGQPHVVAGGLGGPAGQGDGGGGGVDGEPGAVPGTSASMASRSPPSGALIAPTTVTRVSARRPGCGAGRAARRSSSTRQGGAAAAVGEAIRAVARTAQARRMLMRSRRRAARAPSRRPGPTPLGRAAR